MCSITCAISELGTFLDPRNSELVNFLTDIYDAKKQPWARETRTQGDTNIVNPLVNIIGCTTPAWLRENFPDVLVGGGLTSRILFIYGDKRRRYIAYPAREIDTSKYLRMSEVMLHDLSIISELRGAYTLTEEAMDWADTWYRSLDVKRPAHLISDRYSGYLSRKQTHVHKLALILAVSRSNDPIVTLKDLQLAVNMITELEKDMTHVFESIGLAPSGKNIKDIIGLVTAYKEIEYKTLWTLVMDRMPDRDFVAAVKGAQAAGHITRKDKDKKIFFSARPKERI